MDGKKHFDVMRFIGPSVRFQMKSMQRGPMSRDNTSLFEMFSKFTRSWSTRVSIRQGVGAAPSSSTGSHEVLARVSRPFRLRPADPTPPADSEFPPPSRRCLIRSLQPALGLVPPPLVSCPNKDI